MHKVNNMNSEYEDKTIRLLEGRFEEIREMCEKVARVSMKDRTGCDDQMDLARCPPSSIPDEFPFFEVQDLFINEMKKISQEKIMEKRGRRKSRHMSSIATVSLGQREDFANLT